MESVSASLILELWASCELTANFCRMKSCCFYCFSATLCAQPTQQPLPRGSRFSQKVQQRIVELLSNVSTRNMRSSSSLVATLPLFRRNLSIWLRLEICPFFSQSSKVKDSSTVRVCFSNIYSLILASCLISLILCSKYRARVNQRSISSCSPQLQYFLSSAFLVSLSFYLGSSSFERLLRARVPLRQESKPLKIRQSSASVGYILFWSMNSERSSGIRQPLWKQSRRQKTVST